MQPPQFRTDGFGPPCILDVGLSLAPAGLYWTLALARALPVWLPQSHWSIVEDLPYFAKDLRLLARLAGAAAAEAGEVVARTVAAWRDARDAMGFESTPRLYWHEGGRTGSVVPKDGDGGLVERVDALRAGFDGRRDTALRVCGPDALADCARDTASLAAALGGSQPLVLCPLGAGTSTPELADQLQSIGVASARAQASTLLRTWQAPLLQALAVSGLAVPIAAGRLRLAAIAVVAPRVPVLTSAAAECADEMDRLAWNEDAGAAEAALWDDACAVWWELPGC